jgi:hypothetical protein
MDNPQILYNSEHNIIIPYFVKNYFFHTLRFTLADPGHLGSILNITLLSGALAISFTA